jgi:hypothetical protein
MKVVEYDAWSGITETFYKDPSSNVIKIHQTKDLAPLINSNTIERNLSGKGFAGETFHKVASIDPIVLDMWREELKAKGFDNPNPLAKVNKMWLIARLNSRDYQKLRTKEGVI